MFKRGDLNGGSHRGVDSVETYEQRRCMPSEAPVKDSQLVGADGSEDLQESRKSVLSISPMKTNLGLGLFPVQNGLEENGVRGRGCGRSNNCRDGDEHLAYTSQSRCSFVNKDRQLRYNGISISGKIEKMTDGPTNAGVLSRLSEEAGLGKTRRDNSGNSTEAPSPCAICMEGKNGLVKGVVNGVINGVRRKVIKRVEKKDDQGGSGDGSSRDGSSGNSSGGDTNREASPPMRGSERNSADTPRKSDEKDGTKKQERKRAQKKAQKRAQKQAQIADIRKSINNILRSSNVPPKEILKRTSRRFSDTFLYLTKGYHMNVGKVIRKSLYKRNYKNSSLIKISGIHIYSLCKHHLLPFEGECTIEYVPNRYIMGLSKFARVIDIFARRLQLQEDLTNDICNALGRYLKPKYIHVNVVARHLCINMRGVKEHDATTVTNAYYGVKNDTRPNQAVDGLTLAPLP
ncbi:GTP cyclohydrolase I [Plasmodium inui San Antonio 1]|uniref:GTP cyclohydrolase 1 n=1 Tax=Plasmodium inui San Antonio 1 TaxID=1237626 RepID=W7A7F6_9APIC|nr:GTP cyclohydrolase I [Plasmodium inui San Antonio 1]EUD69092.1 GTP cyclohydrolase I [Plasmodium inui San Antonio 1]